MGAIRNEGVLRLCGSLLRITVTVSVVLAGLEDAMLWLVSRDDVPCFDVTSLQD
jgi:hypothetical protein